MALRFEKMQSVRERAVKYWDAYYMWEQCKADPYSNMRDWKDCADACKARLEEWAQEIWRVGGKGKAGGWSIAKCREWVKDHVLITIDRDNAAARNEGRGQ